MEIRKKYLIIMKRGKKEIPMKTQLIQVQSGKYLMRKNDKVFTVKKNNIVYCEESE